MTSQRARALMVEEALVLLEPIARRVRQKFPTVHEHEELVSIAYEGIVAASRTYDPEKGPWKRYAFVRSYYSTRKRTGKEHRDRDRTWKGGLKAVSTLKDPGSLMGDDAAHMQSMESYFDALGAAMFMSCMGSATLGLADPSDAEASIDRARHVAILKAALGELPRDEQTVIEEHYARDRTLRDIVDELQVSYPTVKRRHNAALLALGAALGKKRDKKKRSA